VGVAIGDVAPAEAGPPDDDVPERIPARARRRIGAGDGQVCRYASAWRL